MGKGYKGERTRVSIRVCKERIKGMHIVIGRISHLEHDLPSNLNHFSILKIM